MFPTKFKKIDIQKQDIHPYIKTTTVVKGGTMALFGKLMLTAYTKVKNEIRHIRKFQRNK
jgi:hypothetical protein